MKSRPFCRNPVFTKHFLFFISEGLNQPLSGEVVRKLKNEICHKALWARWWLMEAYRLLFEGWILVANMGEKKGEVNGVNSVFYVCESCRQTMQFYTSGEPL